MTPTYNNIDLSYPADWVAHVQLSRPEKRNALNTRLWKDIGAVFRFLHQDPRTKTVVLSARGSAFCAGLDLKEKRDLLTNLTNDIAETGRKFYDEVKWMQDSFTAIEQCNKPVIVVVHGLCLGAAVSLISAADVIYASRCAQFTVKEVALGLACDVGALNRLPHMVGNQSWLREVCLTGREFDAVEAEKFGLVSKLFDSPSQALQAALETAAQIAANEVSAVQGTKLVLNYARDHAVAESLEFVARLNMSQAFNKNFVNSLKTFKNKL